MRRFFVSFSIKKEKNEVDLSKIRIALARVRDFFCTFVPIINRRKKKWNQNW